MTRNLFLHINQCASLVAIVELSNLKNSCLVWSYLSESISCRVLIIFKYLFSILWSIHCYTFFWVNQMQNNRKNVQKVSDIHTQYLSMIHPQWSNATHSRFFNLYVHNQFHIIVNSLFKELKKGLIYCKLRDR